MSGTGPKRILYVLNYFPYPATSGGRRVSLATLCELGRMGTVDMVCFDEGDRDLDVQGLKQRCPGLNTVKRIPHKRKSKAWLPVFNLTGRSYFFHRDRSEQYSAVVRRMLTENSYDLVFADTGRVTANMRTIMKALRGKVPVAGQLFNVNCLLTRRYLNRSPWLWLFLWLEYRLSRREEIRFWRDLDLAVFISSRDLQIARSMTSDENRFVSSFPCPTDTDISPCDPSISGPVVLHVGTGSWLPNVDALRFFLDEVLPQIQTVVPETVFRCVGGGIPESVQQYSKTNGVQMPGFVENLESEYQQAAVFVVPLRFGSGIKIKILDAMLRGLPIVATSVALEGMPFTVDDGVWKVDTPEGIAAAVIELLRHPQKRAEMGRQARRSIQQLMGRSRLEPLLTELVSRGGNPEVSS